MTDHYVSGILQTRRRIEVRAIASAVRRGRAMTDPRLDVLDRAKRYLSTFPPTSLDRFEEWELVYGMVGFARELVELKTPLDRIEARFKQDLGPALLDKGLAATDISDIVKTASNGQMHGRVRLVDEARRLASQRKAPEPEPPPTSSPAPELAPRTVVPYPNRLHADAFYGVLGDLVRVIEPATEADPAALLLTNLVLFGNIIGRGPHFIAEGSEHHGNLFVAIVGTTSKGRKGSSLSRARAGFAQMDEAWAKDRVTGGLSTGEGLIWFVRDPISKTEAVRQNGRRTGEHEQVTVDEGISDKRALFVEEELAAAFGIMSRQGNSLSGTLRQAWDRGNLAFATKNSPARATVAHSASSATAARRAGQEPHRHRVRQRLCQPVPVLLRRPQQGAPVRRQGGRGRAETCRSPSG